MDISAMQQCLEEASVSLCAQCPAYHLDRVLANTLYSLLCSQPNPLGHLFYVYHEMIFEHHLKQCLLTYKRGLKLAKISSKGVFPLPVGEEMSQDYLLVFVRPPRQMPQAQKALISAANDTQKEILDFYFTVLADMLDFEHMYSGQLGCQNGLPNPQYEAWVHKNIRPDERFDLSWWSTSF